MLLVLTRPTKSLRLTHVASVIVGPLSSNWPDIELRYRGDPNPIASATSSTVVIWNDGNSTLHLEDVVQDDRPRITFAPGIRVLAVNPLKRTDDKSHLEVLGKPGDLEFPIDFAFLNRRHGVAVQFIHTGTELDVIAPRGRLIEETEFAFRDPWNRWISTSIVIFALAWFFAALALLPGSPAPGVPAPTSTIVLSLAPLVAAAVLWILLNRRGQRWQARTRLELTAYLPPVGSQSRDGKLMQPTIQAARAGSNSRT